MAREKKIHGADRRSACTICNADTSRAHRAASEGDRFGLKISRPTPMFRCCPALSCRCAGEAERSSQRDKAKVDTP